MNPHLRAAIRDQHAQHEQGAPERPKTLTGRGRRTPTPADNSAGQAAESANTSDNPQPQEN